MCNLYAMTKSQAAIRDLIRAMHDRTGNLLPLPGIYPDYSAPIVRNGSDNAKLISHTEGRGRSCFGYPHALTRVFSFAQISKRTRPKVIPSPTDPASGVGD
jgi:hypothetical protein